MSSAFRLPCESSSSSLFDDKFWIQSNSFLWFSSQKWDHWVPQDVFLLGSCFPWRGNQNLICCLPPSGFLSRWACHSHSCFISCSFQFLPRFPVPSGHPSSVRHTNSRVSSTRHGPFPGSTVRSAPFPWSQGWVWVLKPCPLLQEVTERMWPQVGQHIWNLHIPSCILGMYSLHTFSFLKNHLFFAALGLCCFVWAFPWLWQVGPTTGFSVR